MGLFFSKKIINRLKSNISDHDWDIRELKKRVYFLEQTHNSLLKEAGIDKLRKSLELLVGEDAEEVLFEENRFNLPLRKSGETDEEFAKRLGIKDRTVKIMKLDNGCENFKTLQEALEHLCCSKNVTFSQEKLNEIAQELEKKHFSSIDTIGKYGEDVKHKIYKITKNIYHVETHENDFEIHTCFYVEDKEDADNFRKNLTDYFYEELKEE